MICRPAVSLVLALLGPAPDPDVATGEEAYRAGDFETAAAAFSRAYERTNDPTYLYTQAQAERQAGRCDVAVELYEEFLGSNPPDQATLAARDNIAACKRELATRAAVSGPPPTVIDPEPEPSAEVSREDEHPMPPRRPWYLDPAGDGLVAAGGLTLAAGGVMLALTPRAARRAEEANDDRSYGDDIARARRLELAGALATSVGAAVLAGGIVRWIVVARQRPRRTALIVAPTIGGLALSGPLGPPRR